jgi:hypothetical protein
MRRVLKTTHGSTESLRTAGPMELLVRVARNLPLDDRSVKPSDSVTDSAASMDGGAEHDDADDYVAFIAERRTKVD